MAFHGWILRRDSSHRKRGHKVDITRRCYCTGWISRLSRGSGSSSPEDRWGLGYWHCRRYKVIIEASKQRCKVFSWTAFLWRDKSLRLFGGEEGRC